MDIKFNHINNPAGVMPAIPKKSGEKKAMIITDSVVKGESMEKLPGKPILQKAGINKSSTSSMKNIASQSAFFMASAPVSGAASLPVVKILDELSKKNISFFKKRGFRIPGFMVKFKQIDVDKAKELITHTKTSKREALTIQVGNSSFIENPTDEDLRDLEIYKDTGKNISSKANDVLAFVKDAVSKDFHLQIKDSKEKGTFVSYRHLMGRGTKPEDLNKPVNVIRKGVSVMTLKPGEFDDIRKLRSSLKTYDGVFKSLDDKSAMVREVLNAPKGVPYPQRIAIAKGIFKHTKEYYGSDQEKNAAKLLNIIAKAVKDPAKYARAGKMMVESLEAYDKEKFEEGYEKGAELIAGKLIDNPDDFAVFIKSLKQGLDYGGLVSMYDNLPQPVNKGDFEKTAKAFIPHKDFCSEKEVKLVMGFAPTASPSDKVNIAKTIFSHSKEYYSSTQWSYVVSDIKKLNELSGSDDELIKLGKMYIQMLESYGAESREDSYLAGLELIAGKLKDNPGEYDSFIKAIKAGVKIAGAVKIHQMLPDTGEKLSYKEAVELFDGGKLVDSKNVEFLMPPIENTTLKDRVEIAEGIHRHSGAYYESYHWTNTKNDYVNIQNISQDTKDFTKIGKMYVEMLDAKNDKDHSSDYKVGLELIVSRFRDKPDEFKIFINAIKEGATIPGAVEMFNRLPETTPLDNTRQEVESFKGSKLQEKGQVELLMPPIGNSTLRDRIEIAEGIFNHSEASYSSQQWGYVVDDYNHIKTLAKKDEDFVKIGKKYVEFLDAFGSKERGYNYREALDFIGSELINKPEEFNVFCSLAKNKMSIKGAIKIYQMLPKPVQRGMYAAVAQVFKGSKLTEEARVELVMTDVEGTSIKDRHDIINDIYKYSKQSQEYYQWSKTQGDYGKIKEKAKDGADFVKIGKCYTQMLKNKESEEFSYEQQYGLDAIIEGLKDKPDDFKVFLDLVKNTQQIDFAVKLYNSLPKPVQKGSFKRASDMFKTGKFLAEEAITLVMEDIKNTTLEDRFAIADGIYRHSVGSYESYRVANTTNDFNFIKQQMEEKGIDFTDVGMKYLRILEASGSEGRKYGYEEGLQYTIDNFLDDPAGFESYLRLIEGSGSVDGAIEAFEKIQIPVGSESYQERENAASKLVGESFEEKYDVAFRNIPPGEKPEDVAALIKAMCEGSSWNIDRMEGILKKFQVHKGSMKSSEPVELVKKFGVFHEPMIIRALDILKDPVGNEPYSHREKIFLTRYEDYKAEPESFDNALADFKATCEGILENETLEESGKRFDKFIELIRNQEKEEYRGDFKSRRHAFTVISRSMNKGILKGKTTEQVFEMLQENLLVAKSLETAADHLAFVAETTGEKYIRKDENQVIIGGVRLRKRGSR